MQLLIGELVSLLNPLGDYMLICAVITTKPTAAKKTGGEAEFSIQHSIEKIGLL
jgi:hypothetical protein